MAIVNGANSINLIDDFTMNPHAYHIPKNRPYADDNTERVIIKMRRSRIGRYIGVGA